ncbi:MAG: 1-deoxy-D-xylulose-5-phosphate synthase [Clostridia bacterium]|nr:1-deoxy-D-xylulose-5-phosphate synthase [Clostridia bacterium]
MLIEQIHEPADLKKLSIKELKQLCEELRAEIINVVSEHGGHLASNLGVVELTVAMHYVFDAPEDKLVMDVGHQSYAHKLLTGRYEAFHTLRQKGGISGFPQMDESEYDAFTAGHASTAISAALGMARTRDIMRGDYDVVALVGDGALTGGMCYEALNDAGQSNTRMIVLLNDNDMSIAQNVGALSRYLTRMRRSKGYIAVKHGVRDRLEKHPRFGAPVYRWLSKTRNILRSLFVDDKFFSALGFSYIGPVDGHDLRHLIRVLRQARAYDKPQLIHVVTQKGRGYQPAEDHPVTFHGVAPFYLESGFSKREGITPSGNVVASQLADMADNDIRICAITAAMPLGTGVDIFQKAHPDRCFDVGIAEEHAVTMAAGMASQGMKPYVAIYSTFLQRAYDQILVDVCRNELPVTFLIDRAGLVGEDGETHQGVFDLSFLRSIPGLVIAAPRDVRDLKKLVELSQDYNGPMAIRYPKVCEDMGPGIQSQQRFDVGQWELLSDGSDVMIFAVGRMVPLAMQAAIELMGKGISAGVVDARFVAPMDMDLLRRKATGVRLAVTVEENVLAGGFGEGVLDALASMDIDVPVLTLGVPDRFIAQATVAQQTAECALDALSIARRIRGRLSSMEEASQ